MDKRSSNSSKLSKIISKMDIIISVELNILYYLLSLFVSMLPSIIECIFFRNSIFCPCLFGKTALKFLIILNIVRFNSVSKLLKKHKTSLCKFEHFFQDIFLVHLEFRQLIWDLYKGLEFSRQNWVEKGSFDLHGHRS